MKGLYLEKVGSPLEYKELPEPELQPGAAVVKIIAAPILSYMKQVVSGELGFYVLPTPFIPGSNGVGIVESVAEDVIGIQPGQLVYLDPYLYTETTTGFYDGILIGLTALGPGSLNLQQTWRNGTFAQKALWPASRLTVLDAVKSIDPYQLASLTSLMVPYGGLLKGNLSPSQTIIITGATGNFGSGGVLMALAMGAGKVVPVGRNQPILEQLQTLDPKRVIPVTLTGDAEQDQQQIANVAQGADLLLDLVGHSPDATATISGIQALRPGGTAVLMGGVQGMVSVPYGQILMNQITITGQFMYPTTAPGDLVNLLSLGRLDLSAMKLKRFGLEEFNQALDHASVTKGLEYTMLCP